MYSAATKWKTVVTTYRYCVYHLPTTCHVHINFSVSSVCCLNVRQRLYSTVTYIQDGGECQWNALTSCKRFFHWTFRFLAVCKNSSILQSVQTGFVALPAPIKGVSGAATLGNKSTAVRSVQLTTASNVDVKNEWRYTTLLPSPTNFPKIKDPS